MRKIEAHLIEGFVQLNQFLIDHDLRFCLIGGIAAGYWGEPRFTRDIDFTIFSQKKSFDEIVSLLEKNNFIYKLIENSQCQISKWNKINFWADLILAETDYQDLVIDRAMKINLFEVETKICSAEDLMILKMIAGRRQDYLDIENILKKNLNQLDKSYLLKWLMRWDLKEKFENEFNMKL